MRMMTTSTSTTTDSWTDLESKCGNHGNDEPPTTITLDHVPSRQELEEFSKAEQSHHGVPQNYSPAIPWLVRDAEGVDPYAQQVWLALELKTTQYCTILVSSPDPNIANDNDNNNDNMNSRSDQLPQLFWPTEENHENRSEENEETSRQKNQHSNHYLVGQQQTLDMLESIQERYCNDGPDFYRRISKAVDNVRCNIVRFHPVFPRNTMFLPHVPYQFVLQTNDDDDQKERMISLVTSNNHMVTLEETDEVLEEYDEGSWFCGDFVSAADVVWAPFLERYAAQLPLIMDGDEHDPRHPKEYPAIAAWFHAMECHVPCYSCRVAGDATTWSRHLHTTLATDPRFSHIPTRTKQNPRLLHSISNPRTLWNQYIQNRPWLAPTPEAECAAFFVRHRSVILQEALADQTTNPQSMTEDEADIAYRQVLEQLLVVSEMNDEEYTNRDMSIMACSLSEHAKEMLHFIDQRLQVPRDMGMLPASTLRSLAAALLLKPSIIS